MGRQTLKNLFEKLLGLGKTSACKLLEINSERKKNALSRRLSLQEKEIFQNKTKTKQKRQSIFGTFLKKKRWH